MLIPIGRYAGVIGDVCVSSSYLLIAMFVDSGVVYGPLLPHYLSLPPQRLGRVGGRGRSRLGVEHQ